MTKDRELKLKEIIRRSAKDLIEMDESLKNTKGHPSALMDFMMGRTDKDLNTLLEEAVESGEADAFSEEYKKSELDDILDIVCKKDDKVTQ